MKLEWFEIEHKFLWFPLYLKKKNVTYTTNKKQFKWLVWAFIGTIYKLEPVNMGDYTNNKQLIWEDKEQYLKYYDIYRNTVKITLKVI